VKRLAALLAGMSLAIGLGACGGSAASTTARDTSSGNAAGDRVSSAPRKRDRDDDEDNNDDDYHILGFGHVANAPEKREITTLIDHYFSIAVARDGKGACALLTPFIAESVVEEDGDAPGLHGRSCAVVMSKLFTQHHQELVGKRAGLKVMRIGIEGDVSLVALAFSEIPVVREIILRRVGGRWTVRELLDGLME
jgi:hypothetical protein